MASRAWCRCSRTTCWPNSASSPARTATASASPATCARAREPWISSSSRCCRIRRWWCLAPARWRCRWRRRRGSSAITSRWRRPRTICLSMPDADTLIDGFALGELHPAKRFIVVSTQGKGDEAALRAAVATDAAYHAFVGSRRKMTALREKLVADGVVAGSARPRQGAGRPRSRRHHAGRDRDVDTGRNHRRAAHEASAPVTYFSRKLNPYHADE